MKTKLIIFIALFFFSNALAQTTYFLRNDGDDANSGTTYDLAFATLDTALVYATTAGDEIILINYTETRTSNITPSTNVNFIGVGNNTITFNGQYGLNKADFTGDFTIKNITFVASTPYTGTRFVIGNNPSSTTTIEKVSFINMSLADGGGSWNFSTVKFEGNTVIKQSYFKNTGIMVYNDSVGSFVEKSSIENSVFKTDASTGVVALIAIYTNAVQGYVDVRNSIFIGNTGGAAKVHFIYYNAWADSNIAKFIGRNNIFSSNASLTAKYNKSTSLNVITEIDFTGYSNHNANDTTLAWSLVDTQLKISDDGITAYDSIIFTDPLSADDPNTGVSFIDNYVLKGSVAYRGIAQNKRKINITN